MHCLNFLHISEKKCVSPPSLPMGSVPNVTFPYVSNIYTYGTAATYQCDLGYEFDDASTDVTIACRQDNNWDNITQTCKSKDI